MASPPAHETRTEGRNWGVPGRGRCEAMSAGVRGTTVGVEVATGGEEVGGAYACGALAVPIDDHLGDGEGRFKAKGGEAEEGDVQVEVVQEEVADADEGGVQAEELDVAAEMEGSAENGVSDARPAGEASGGSAPQGQFVVSKWNSPSE